MLCTNEGETRNDLTVLYTVIILLLIWFLWFTHHPQTKHSWYKELLQKLGRKRCVCVTVHWIEVQYLPSSRITVISYTNLSLWFLFWIHFVLLQSVVNDAVHISVTPNKKSRRNGMEWCDCVRGHGLDEDEARELLPCEWDGCIATKY